MTPADKMRTAAAHLREDAANAPALVAQGLAEPLAELLEEAAHQADMNIDRAPRHRRGTSHALAVARFINHRKAQRT